MAAAALGRLYSWLAVAAPPAPNLRPPFYRPQHCLYFFPLLHGQGSLRPTLGALRTGLVLETASVASVTISLALGEPGAACVAGEAWVPPPKDEAVGWARFCCKLFQKFW